MSSPAPPEATQPWLRRIDDPHGEDARAVDTVIDSWGGRVGLPAVLADLNRNAVSVRAPASAADYGFRWNLCDEYTRTWWPQGITSSADAHESGQVDGRRVVVVAWYAKQRGGVSKGVRLTIVDVGQPARPAYRHVLLTQPHLERSAGPAARPVIVHAGGLAWCGSSILVADTRGGIRVFEIDDICRVPWRDGMLGYRYVLPQRTAWVAGNPVGQAPLRFSFLSLDRSAGSLVVGEYGREDQTTRLHRFPFDLGSRSPRFDSEDIAASDARIDGIEGMQGAVIVDDTWYVTTSHGRARRGSLSTRKTGGSFQAHRGVLSVGPEDLTYWPEHDRLWTCSEWPGRRYVYALPRHQFA